MADRAKTAARRAVAGEEGFVNDDDVDDGGGCFVCVCVCLSD